MTDEILTTVLFLSHERDHTGQSRVTETHVHSWPPHCARKRSQKIAGVVHSACLCAVNQQNDKQRKKGKKKKKDKKVKKDKNKKRGREKERETLLTADISLMVT